MIQIRWVIRIVSKEISLVGKEKVLQYREKQDLSGDFMFDKLVPRPEWSKWQDVPVEVEE